MSLKSASRTTSSLPSPCPSSHSIIRPPSRRSHHEHAPQEQTIVTFPTGDPENPYNWSRGKKTYVLLTCMVLVMNSTLGMNTMSLSK
jgi:hypothetical protein